MSLGKNSPNNLTRTLDLSKANIELPPDPQITVTAKSTIGDVNEPLDNNSINPLILISPTFPTETNTQSPELPDTTTTKKPTKPTKATTTTSKKEITTTTEAITTTTIKPKIEDVVLDVPARMQDTLMRLMQKTGLRRDPIARLVMDFLIF